MDGRIAYAWSNSRRSMRSDSPIHCRSQSMVSRHARVDSSTKMNEPNSYLAEAIGALAHEKRHVPASFGAFVGQRAGTQRLARARWTVEQNTARRVHLKISNAAESAHEQCQPSPTTVTLKRWKISGYSKGNTIISFRARMWWSRPPMSSNVVFLLRGAEKGK